MMDDCKNTSRFFIFNLIIPISKPHFETFDSVKESFQKLILLLINQITFLYYGKIFLKNFNSRSIKARLMIFLVNPEKKEKVKMFRWASPLK